MASGDVERIKKMYNSLSRESEGIYNNVISIAYFMRGGITYDDLMFRTPYERDLINTFLEKRLDAESNRLHPNY